MFDIFWSNIGWLATTELHIWHLEYAKSSKHVWIETPPLFFFFLIEYIQVVGNLDQKEYKLETFVYIYHKYIIQKRHHQAKN